MITGPPGPVIYEYYGATETGAFIIQGSEEALAKPGTVGRPLPGGTVRIYDADGGTLPTDAVGEIHLWLEGVPDLTYHRLDDKRRPVEIADIAECHEAVAPDIVARATW